MLISLEGLDQAGKNSTGKIIVKKLRKSGLRVSIISFPDYTTAIGREIRRFLQGTRMYSPEVRQLLYVANRFERKDKIEYLLNDGQIVIADRYTASGLAYGLANGLDLDWMIDLERGLPESDLTILIDVPAKIASQREADKDVYERDLQFQENVRAAYLNLADEFHWFVVNGERSLNEVVEEVWEIILKTVKSTNV